MAYYLYFVIIYYLQNCGLLAHEHDLLLSKMDHYQYDLNQIKCGRKKEDKRRVSIRTMVNSGALSLDSFLLYLSGND